MCEAWEAGLLSPGDRLLLLRLRRRLHVGRRHDPLEPPVSGKRQRSCQGGPSWESGCDDSLQPSGTGSDRPRGPGRLRHRRQPGASGGPRRRPSPRRGVRHGHRVPGGQRGPRAAASALCPGSIVVRIDVTIPESVAEGLRRGREDAGAPSRCWSTKRQGCARGRAFSCAIEGTGTGTTSSPPNLTGAFPLHQARPLPGMLKRGGWGRIVNIGSVAGSGRKPGTGELRSGQGGASGLHESRWPGRWAAHGVTRQRGSTGPRGQPP